MRSRLTSLLSAAGVAGGRSWLLIAGLGILVGAAPGSSSGDLGMEVTGVVTTREGTPCVGCEVTAIGDRADRTYRARTDSKGRFLLAGLPADAMVGGQVAAATRCIEKDDEAADGVFLEVGLPHEIGIGDEIEPGDQLRYFVVTLRLVNRSKMPVYVSPVIGEVRGRLRIFARRAESTDLPSALYDRTVLTPGFDIDDLFKLRPGRSLERPMGFQYPKSRHLPEEGWIEIWAEYDCRAMKEANPRAFGALLKSEAVAVPVKRLRRP